MIGFYGLKGAHNMHENSKEKIPKQNEYGMLYYRWCTKINNRFPKSPSKLEKLEKQKKSRYKNADERYNKTLLEFREIEQKYSEEEKTYKTFEKKLKLAEKAKNKAERIYKQEEFNKAVDFLGMEITLDEVMVFSGFCSMLSLIIAMLLVIPLFIFLNLDIMEAGMFLVPGILLTPVIVFAFVASYPEILADRVKTKSLGRTPESVNYIVMSMRLSPSLSKAVAFASESSDEPIASGLKKVLWDIYMRKFDSIEESFLAFAYDWGEINEDFKRSLYTIRSSTLESTDEGRERILDKASEIILEGTKRRIEAFAASLHGPATVLFALGILLPMIIGAMLPLMALQIPRGGNFQTNTQSSLETSPDIGSAIAIIVLMDIIFPLIAFIYAYYILGKRPGTATPPDVKSKLSKKQGNTIIATSIFLFTGCGILSLPYLRSYLGGLGSILGPVPIIIGFAFAMGYFLRATSKYQKKRRDEIKKMEEEFPDALFKLGSRIAEGEPLETALLKVAESTKGLKIAELFEKISYTIQVTRTTPYEAMFGKEFGVLKDIPSRTIRASMKTVVESVGKDAATAGSIIINVSNYLRDMKKVEHDIKTSLSQTVEMMKSTGILFAPLVMGITASLYVLLSKEFSAIPGSTQLLSNDVFFMVIGIYLVLMVMITTYFSVGIEHGEDKVELKHSIGSAVPVAVLVYSFSLILGQILIG
jgi:Flp pilus assembly protein TadB